MDEMSLCGFCGEFVSRACSQCPRCGSLHRDTLRPGIGSVSPVDQRIAQLLVNADALEAEIDRFLADEACVTA
jgi:primosomal protein N'